MHVDTQEGVVYLTGSVDSGEMKTRAEAAATAVEVRNVVSHLVARPEATDVTPSALPTAVARPVPPMLTGVARIEGQRYLVVLWHVPSSEPAR